MAASDPAGPAAVTALEDAPYERKVSAGSVGADEMATLSHAAEVGLRSEAWNDVERSVAGLGPAFVRLEEAIAAVGA